MVTNPLCVHTLPLQVWQHNKWKGLTPAACGKSLHIGVGLVLSQQDVDGTSSMFPSLLCNGSSTSCRSKNKGEQQFQAHCAKMMLRQSLLTTHSYFLSLGPP